MSDEVKPEGIDTAKLKKAHKRSSVRKSRAAEKASAQAPWKFPRILLRKRSR